MPRLRDAAAPARLRKIVHEKSRSPKDLAQGFRPMSRPPSSRRPAKRAAKSGTAHVIRTLIAGRANPAELFELHYLTREPGVLYLLRAIAAMPDDTRAALEAFVALTRDPKVIAAQLDPRGILTLASPEAAKVLAIAQYLAQVDSDGAPRLLN
jgi:hypothetical protein